jgi:hypothetical protein
MVPTYMAKYPPGQGLVMALGRVLMGEFLLGIWLSVGLMVVSFYFLLSARLPRAWAVSGAILSLVLLGGPGYWAQSYWGGALAASAGALWFGAVFRFVNRPSSSLAIMAGLGASLLAITRPLEGLVAVSLTGPWLLARILSDPRVRPRALRRIAVAAIPVLLTAVWHGHYNLRVTGSPVRMPYSVYEDQYALAPNLLVLPQPELEKAYRHESIRKYHEEWGRQRWEYMRRPAVFVASRVHQIGNALYFFVGPLLLALAGLRQFRVRKALSGVGLPLISVTAIVSLSMGAYPHYMAPVAGLYVVVALTCLRHLLRSRRPVRKYLGLISLALLVVHSAGRTLRQGRAPDGELARRRALVERRLQRIEGRDLVLLRSVPPSMEENLWTYNGADLSDAAVLWGHSMGPAKDARLREVYSDRTAWLLELSADDSLSLQLLGKPLQREPVYPLPSQEQARSVVPAEVDSPRTGSN